MAAKITSSFHAPAARIVPLPKNAVKIQAEKTVDFGKKVSPTKVGMTTKGISAPFKPPRAGAGERGAYSYRRPGSTYGK